MKLLPQCLLVLIVGVFLISVAILTKTQVLVTLPYSVISSQNEIPTNGDVYDAHLLDGCYHIYLDVGTNVGVQIRKLYEPQLYPDAKVHKIFKSYFNQSTLPWLCTVGFEPNPHHTKDLSALQSAYEKCGNRVHIFRESAVGNYDGETIFFSDNELEKLEWGGTIIDPADHKYGQIKGPAKSSFKVQVVKLSRFINEVVAKRKIPSNDQLTHEGQPKVLMKMDIEGSEVEVLPDLICSGTLNVINGIMVEFHEFMASDPKRKAATKELRSFVKSAVNFNNLIRKDSAKTEIIALDDETYHLSNFPLPNCK